MRAIRTLVFNTLSGVALACVAHAQDDSAVAAFGKLKVLTGDWEGTLEWTGARNGTGSMNAAYYLTGNGSALVENLIKQNVPSRWLRPPSDALLRGAKSAAPQGEAFLFQ